MLAKAPFDAAGETYSYDHGLSGRLRSRGNLSQDNAVAWIDRLLTAIDDLVSAQVNAILHDPHFQRLEARWRGLAYLVQVAQDVPNVELKVLSVPWVELCRDLDRAVEFDQSRLFRLVYGDEFDMPGGEPFGLMVGDYEVAHRVQELSDR